MINAIEEAVRSVYAELRERYAGEGYCACERCQADVLARALNNVRPRYVTGNNTVGAAVTRVALGDTASRAEVSVLVIDAMRLVARNPRHDPPPS